MHRQIRMVSILAVVLITGLSACSEEKELPSERLWYRQPAANWFEALPLGNGRLGAMVFGGLDPEHLQLNEESLWAGCPEDPYPEGVEVHYPRFQQLNLEGKFQEAYAYAQEHLPARPTSIRSYQPLGDLYLDFAHAGAVDYKRSLDLSSGIVLIEYNVDGNRFKRETFIPEDQDVLIYRFESLDDVPVDCEISFDREKDVVVHNQPNEIVIMGQIFDDPNGYDDNPGGSGEGGKHMKFAGLAKLKLDGGASSQTDSSVLIRGAKSFTLIFGAGTNYNLDRLNFDEQIPYAENVRRQVEAAAETPYAAIRETHIGRHSAVYDRVRLDISGVTQDTIPTDERLEAVKAGGSDPYLAQLLFQYGRYLLMGSSGGKAVLPANLQGIWNQDMWAAWESDFHLNINLQMNYWPADVCNLSETMQPLSAFMVKLAENGRTTAQKFIGSEGWMAHHVTNPFGRTTPSGSTVGSQITNGYSFPLAGAWMSMTLWRHYEFTQDEAYLKDTAYPVLNGAARFILDFLKEDTNGYLVTAPSYSPENTYIDPETGRPMRNTVAASIDIQIIRDVFRACLQAEELLQEENLTNEIEAALKQLPPIRIGQNGTIQEWMEDYEEGEPGHRHISHLYALHPSNQISPATPELFDAARKTLERRLSFGGGQTGWSRAWMISFFARLNDGDACLHHINELLKNQITPNLFDLHPPHIFQIDGNLGATAGIAEMLIQSHEPGVIRLLPALPAEWKNGSVQGLKARGNFVVDMQWKDGALTQASVQAVKGGRTKVVYDDQAFELDLAAKEMRALDLGK